MPNLLVHVHTLDYCRYLNDFTETDELNELDDISSFEDSDSCASDVCSLGSGGVQEPDEREPTDEHEPMSFEQYSDVGSLGMQSDSSEECPESSDDQSDLDSDIEVCHSLCAWRSLTLYVVLCTAFFFMYIYMYAYRKQLK